MPKIFFFIVFIFCGSQLLASFPFVSSIKNDTSEISDNLDQLLRNAELKSRALQYADALSIYHKALRITNKNGLPKQAGLIYKKIGLIYFKQGRLEKAKKSFKKCISKDSISEIAADSYFNLALVQRKLKNKDSLLFFMNKSLIIFQNKKSSEAKFETYRKAGVLFKNMANYEDALKYLLLAHEGFGEIRNEPKKAVVCNTIGATQRLLGNYKVAKRYYWQGLMIKKKVGDSLGISYSYNNLANAYKESEVYDSAITYYKKGIALKNKLKNKKELGRMLSNLASVHYLNKDFNFAFSSYLKALEQKKKEKDSLSILYTINELAITLIKLDRPEEAKIYLDSSQIYLNSITSFDAAIRNLQVTALYYEKVGNLQNALDFQKKYIDQYKSAFSEKQSKKIQELQELFESQQKQNQIETLSLTNKNNEFIIQNQEEKMHRKSLSQLLMLTLLVVITGLFFVLKQRQKIILHRHELEKLEAIFKEEETLKTNISKDLHDMIATSYDGIRLKVLALKNSKDPVSLTKNIIDEMKGVNQDIRLISHRLSPLSSKIKDASFNEIIIAYLSEIQHYNNIFIDIHLPLPKVLNHMNMDAQTNFYGILLEIVHNISKHATATRVKIRHQLSEENVLQFVVTDNGIGFSKNSKEGMGLKNIRQRARLLVGKATIKTSKQGTSINLKFPVKTNLS